MRLKAILCTLVASLALSVPSGYGHPTAPTRAQIADYVAVFSVRPTMRTPDYARTLLDGEQDASQIPGLPGSRLDRGRFFFSRLMLPRLSDAYGSVVTYASYGIEMRTENPPAAAGRPGATQMVAFDVKHWVLFDNAPGSCSDLAAGIEGGLKSLAGHPPVSAGARRVMFLFSDGRHNCDDGKTDALDTALQDLQKKHVELVVFGVGTRPLYHERNGLAALALFAFDAPVYPVYCDPCDAGAVPRLDKDRKLSGYYPLQHNLDDAYLQRVAMLAGGRYIWLMPGGKLPQDWY